MESNIRQNIGLPRVGWQESLEKIVADPAMKLIFDLPRDHKKIAWLKSRIMLESRYLFGQNSKKSLVNPGIGGFVKLHNYSLFNWCTVFHKKILHSQ